MKFLTNLHKNKTGALRKLPMQIEIPSCLGYGQDGYDAQAKINVFYQLTLLSNDLVFISYLYLHMNWQFHSDIYIESWFSWLEG